MHKNVPTSLLPIYVYHSRCEWAVSRFVYLVVLLALPLRDSVSLHVYACICVLATMWCGVICTNINMMPATNHVSAFYFVWNKYGYGFIWLVDEYRFHYPVNLNAIASLTNKYDFLTLILLVLVIRCFFLYFIPYVQRSICLFTYYKIVCFHGKAAFCK